MQAEDATGRSVLPRGRKTRAALAVLALASPRPVPRAQLIALLWSRRQPQQAKGSLRQTLHELRDSLHRLGAPLLEIDRTQVTLRPDRVEVDVASPDPERQDLQAGQPGLLEDLSGIDPAFDTWLAAERGNLARRALARAEAALRSANSPEQMEAAAEILLAIDRSHEGAWQALMRARLDQGDAVAARVAFEQCRAALVTAGQHTPSAQTAALLDEAAVQPASSRPAQSDLLPPACPAVARRAGGCLRVGVAPLRALAGPIAHDLAAALAEELTAALARFRWLSCVPVTAFDLWWAREAPWRGAELDLLLDGSVQQSGEQIRVLTRLRDLRSAGEVVWSARFDRAVGVILELQDDIAARAAAQLEPRLLLWEAERVSGLSHANPVAHQLLHAAIPHLFRLDRSGFHSAGEKLEQALRLDPGNPRIHTWLAQWYLFTLGQGWTDHPADAASRARDLANSAAALAPDDARALTVAGHVRGFVEKRPDEALELLDRSIAANPNLPLAWCRSAYALCYAGQHAEALRRAARARSLSLDDPFGFIFDEALAVAHLLRGEYETAVQFGTRAIALNPAFSSSFKTQLAALGHLGRREQAAVVRARLLAIEPRLSVAQALERSPIRRPEDRARYADGLRLGGLT